MYGNQTSHSRYWSESCPPRAYDKPRKRLFGKSESGQPECRKQNRQHHDVPGRYHRFHAFPRALSTESTGASTNFFTGLPSLMLCAVCTAIDPITDGKNADVCV